MRLCANVPCQHAVQTALGGYQSINGLVVPGGRLYEQMDLAHKLVTQIDGISCVRPKGAMYLFPKIDRKKFRIKDDELFVLDFLRQHKVLLVHGRAFNWPEPDHFRIVFLPHKEQLEMALGKVAAVHTSEGRVVADAFVLALGSYSPIVLKPLGIKLPVYPVKGYSLTIPRPRVASSKGDQLQRHYMSWC